MVGPGSGGSSSQQQLIKNSACRTVCNKHKALQISFPEGREQERVILRDIVPQLSQYIKKLQPAFSSEQQLSCFFMINLSLNAR